MIIGNGWIAPKEQYESYLPFAYEQKLLKKESIEGQKLEKQLQTCETKLAVEVKIDVPVCESVLQDFLQLTGHVGSNGKRQCHNMYDVRLSDEYPSCGMNWPPDLPDVTKYLRQAKVTQALHIGTGKSTGWKECNGAVGSAFRAHNSAPSIDLLPAILKEVPITLFSGAKDLICNHIGTEKLIDNMEWNGGKGWALDSAENAPRRDWKFEGEEAGFWQEARNLTYVLFNDASHMVPFDWPRRSQDMLNRVMGVQASLGGQYPVDSHIEGEVVNNHTLTDEPDTQKQVDQAKWDAYYKSGSIVLVIVIIAAGAWGWYIWRERRKRRGYQGLAGGEAAQRGGAQRPLERFQERRPMRDVESADFDESELDDLHLATPTDSGEKNPYAVGGDSDDEYEKKRSAAGSSSAR